MISFFLVAIVGAGISVTYWIGIQKAFAAMKSASVAEVNSGPVAGSPSSSTASTHPESAQQQGSKPADAKPEERKAKPKASVEQSSKGDNSPNINQQSSGSNSPNIIGNNNTVNTSDPQVAAHVEEILGLLKSRGDDVSPAKLLSKYPLGYVIFDVDYKNSVFPYRNEGLEKWDFDWNVVNVTENSEHTVVIRMPDIRSKRKGGPQITDTTLGNPKKVGPFGNFFSDGVIAVKAEILAISEKGIVFLIGIDHVSKPQ